MEHQQTSPKPTLGIQQSFSQTGGAQQMIQRKSNTVYNSPERQGTTVTNQSPMNFGGGGGSQLDVNEMTSTTRNLYKSQESAQNNPAIGHDEREGLQNYLKMKVELDDCIKDLDVKLNRVLAKQEYEYLKGYNVYVKQKEKELKQTINQLSERFNNTSAKDKKLMTLQRAIKSIREEQIKMDRENVQLKDKVKTQKAQIEEVTSERDFYQGKTKEIKKKNHLLKLAILRLQQEIDNMKNQDKVRQQEEYEQEKSQFFLTELNGGSKKQSPRGSFPPSTTHAGASSKLHGISILTNDVSKTLESSTILEEEGSATIKVTQGNLTLLEPSMLSLGGGKHMRSNGGSNTTSKSKTAHKRFKSNSTLGSGFSRYAHIMSENLKFDQFVEALFSSKMTNNDIKEEVKSYVQVLETNYNDTIRELKTQEERLQKQLRQAKSDQANVQHEKTEVETIFIECIEDVRKEIMKRRLKNEVRSTTQRKQTKSKLQAASDLEELQSKDFEDSLMRLASFAKGRIKYGDFNSKDKFNILDLFVNNEKTLIHIYQALFPHRSNAGGAKQGPLPNSLSQTSTNDRSIGRYGYHSGVAMVSPQLPDSPMGQQQTSGKVLLSTTSPVNGPGMKQYGSSLYNRQHQQQQLIHIQTDQQHINEESSFILPNIVTTSHQKYAQSSLR